MVIDYDWLRDPIMIVTEGRFEYLNLRNSSLKDDWEGFHYSTRLKLEGAVYFCSQVLGTVSLPTRLGLPLLADRMLEWYVDAFFFELQSAHDLLLQELNVLYASDLGLDVEAVRWESIKDRLPKELCQYMESEWQSLWFRKLRQHRNRAAHHHHLEQASWSVGFGGKPWDATEHKNYMAYIDPEKGEMALEDVEECRIYLKKMLTYINNVWERMKQEFDVPASGDPKDQQ